MIAELIRVGDLVRVTIPPDSREWGYNPCPDGTIAEVEGFNTTAYGRVNNFGRRPGIYLNRSWAKVNAVVHGVRKSWSEFCGRLDLIDEDEYQGRKQAWRDGGEISGCKADDFICELPNLPFWEGDIVRCRDYDHVVIVGIKYENIGSRRDDGSELPLYDISSSFDAGWRTTRDHESFELIERGPVWKYYHDEPVQFDSVEDEVKLHQLLSLYSEVRNPSSELYRWELDEALQAIADGVGDCFTAGTTFGSSSCHISVIKLHDADLGRKIAAVTLAGFRA